ncbi:unnamed protein product, partial [Ixodes hexagonus]
MLDVSDVVGRLGWYHAAIGAVTVLRAFPTAWTLLVVPFIVPPVDHWCAMPSLPALQNWTLERWKLSAIPVMSNGSDEGSLVLDGCSVHPLLSAELAVFDKENAVECDSWTYNETVPGASAVPEWDLVCSNDWQRSMMQSVVFLGSLVGALIIGRLSDSTEKFVGSFWRPARPTSLRILSSHLANVWVLALIPSKMLSALFFNYISNRKAKANCGCIGPLALAVTNVSVENSLWMRLGLNMTCRFILVISAAVKWVYSMEVFPTAARGFGFSACFTMGRVGGMLAPFMRDLVREIPWDLPV